MPDSIALIAGATGAAGSRLTALVAATPGWLFEAGIDVVHETQHPVWCCERDDDGYHD